MTGSAAVTAAATPTDAAAAAPRRGAGRSRVVSSISAARFAAAVVAAAASASSALRFARSAAVVSVVRAAATCWVWRFVDAVAGRPRAAGVFVADVRAARAVFAASPRAAAAFDDAARDAAVRFEDAVDFASSPEASSAAAPRAAFFAVVVRGPFEALAAFAAVVPFEVVEDFVVFVALGELPLFGVVGEAAASVDFTAFCAVGVTARPRSADTAVPVPSGASSSCSERETEVTQTTYQRAPGYGSRRPPNHPPAVDSLNVASRSHYENATPSWNAPRPRYPELRHNGVSTCDLSDDSWGNAR